MSGIGYEELNALSGELLPERMLLSIVIIDNSTRNTYNFPSGGDGKGGTTVAYACQAQQTQASGGLLAALGLGTPASSSMTCVPAAVVTR
ncbi:hypothetical protein SGFS_075320 [Streptomyces graminofaciens]|jgi:hypothetical protein|uniref:Uncharacterized protein n=1 Tax=Streptomyces graminofaciens TaxID=68212 RepID=A0ABN5VUN4_9ACTN|nr:hypothetical protein [Streptomyces graminofaciens]BBC36238.1 hypothetical protein SGFS_075320 [Streptomyces graminofaciens]